jgi:hypothetical protein
MYSRLLRVGDDTYTIKRIIPFDNVKNEDLLREVMYQFCGADTLIKDNKNSKYLLTQRIDDALILWETETNEKRQTDDSNTIQE